MSVTRRLLTLSILLASMITAGLACGEEKTSAISTQVQVTGEVKRAAAFTPDDLTAIAKRKAAVEVRGYRGIRLTDLLDETEVREDTPNALRRTYVVASATDGYIAIFSRAELYNSALGKGVIVAWEKNGKPLSDSEGRIAMVTDSDLKPGPRHVRGLSRIDVRRVVP